jgi:predicted aspartyl protease
MTPVFLVPGLLAASLSSASTDAAPHRAALEVSSGRPVVEVMINGEGPYPFVLDTGAGALVLRSSVVEELGLEVIGQQQVGSPLGAQPLTADLVAVDRLSLGGAEILDRQAVVIDMPGAPPSFVGVIGPNQFADFRRVAFDFETYEVEIGGAFVHGESEQWLAIGDYAPIIETDAMIGDIPLVVHIDTGSPGVLSVPEASADSLPLTGPVTVIGRGRTVDAEFEIRGAPLDGVAEVAGATIPLDNVHFLQASFGNLGMGGLHGLQLEYDWEEERFALSGEAEPRAMRPQRRMVRQDD